jgi:hypothetical protein
MKNGIAGLLRAAQLIAGAVGSRAKEIHRSHGEGYFAAQGRFTVRAALWERCMRWRWDSDVGARSASGAVDGFDCGQREKDA